MAARGLQVILVAAGAVAVTFGLMTVATGVAAIPDAGPVTANVDSELRFYAAWYVGAGAVLIWIAGRVERAGRVLRAVSGVLLLAAAGRVVSIVAVGAPHPVFQVLLAIEVAIPLVVVPWQAAVARASR